MRKHNPAKAMIVAGVMSGTSADGVDVAVCRIWESNDGEPKIEVLGHRGFAYEKRLRKLVLSAASGASLSAAEFARLSWRLGDVYATCVDITARELQAELDLVACHGQTIYHQSGAKKYLGSPLRCTWQMGEASLIAERLHVPVVSDFRPADMAAGGQGAPLVPMLDFCMFRDPTKNRLLLNLGGIANMTALPAACNVDDVMAFDTGPANMVVDAVMHELYGRRFDKDGLIASRGRALDGILEKLLQASYFSSPPPKSCGREEFGSAFVDHLLRLCSGAKKRDIVATATLLSALSIAKAYTKFVAPHMGQCKTEMFVAGGGAKNVVLMRMLRERFSPLGVTVATTAETGSSVRMDVEAKEAVAFALLGWLTWHGLRGNVPSATGARRPVVVGKVTHV